jgi:NAD(P)-dependent dehydrogenase (short-subunit alcohol dehydrogenase family)
VVGGAGHIGGAVCEALAEQGALVAVADLEGAEERVAQLEERGAERAVAIACDVGNEPSARAAWREAVRSLGSLDILVHCAALVGTTQLEGWAAPFAEQTVAAWDRALSVNLTSAFVLAREARAELSARGRGSIVLFGSTYGLVGPDFQLYEDTPMANPAAYGVSKAGLLQLVRYLATALAPGVRVNAISPGGVERGQPEVFQARYRERTPLGRLATEEDLKGAIAYLASDLSSYVTGHNLVVDGGWTAW